MNFGGFATPERALAFDINDFDETAIGPWEWDLKRLAASLCIAVRHLGHGDKLADEVVCDRRAKLSALDRQPTRR